MYEQYGRRECIEITGIPTDIAQEDLEEQVIKIYNEAKVEVHGRELNRFDISAYHRLGKKSVTIVKFVNRKCTYAGLSKGKNLKGSKLYGNSPIYINNSFCKEFNRFGFLIRKLKRSSHIAGYKVKNGVYQIKTVENGVFVEISHTSDFSKYNLDVPNL